VLKPTGGRVHAFIATLPTCGSRALKLRDQPAASERADKEKQAALLSADNTFKTLGAAAADFQVSVDLFFVGQAYVDVATFSDLPNMTGGSVYNYIPYNPMLDQDQLFNDLKWNVERPQGLEGIMRVRCSAGLDVDCYYGAFYKRPTNPTDVDLPAVDCDKAVIAKVQHVDKLQVNSDAYFQAALLYTSMEGQRRIRVHTLALPVSDSISTVFKSADLDAQLAVLVRQTAIQVPGSALNVVKDTVISKAVSTLHAYRRYCATSSSSVQLILPEALKLLPLYALGLLKSAGLRWDVKPDERATWLAAVTGATCSKLTPMLYGRLVPVHKLLQQQQGEGGELEVPDGSLLSSEVFEAGGVYLLENGRDALVAIDKLAPAAVWQEVAGVGSSEELSRQPAPVQLVARDAPLSRLLQQLLVRVRQQRCSYMRLRLVRKGDSSEVMFLNSLVEDRSTAGMSYVEHLCHVHRLIQAKMG
jgi:protein transport protein SEC24